MKTKQILGIVVAAVMFVFVCGMGVLSNQLGQSMSQSNQVVTDTLGSLTSGPVITEPEHDYVGIIRVEGTISGGGDTSSIFEAASGYNHEQNMKFVDKMINSANNKGILLYVDSPGGTVYHSDEMYLKLMEYKEKTGRPIQAFFASEACSGGYYISMASDYITANRNCWLGSIGVIIQMQNLKGLYDKLGIKEIDIVSGANKAMGSSGLDMTEEQRNILQGLVDEAYEQFVDIVAKGRGMTAEQVKPLADGRLYSALQGEENGLVDAVGDYEQAKETMGMEVGSPDIDFYEPQTNEVTNLFSSLFSAYQSTREKSDAQILTEYLEEKGNGVLMYYAE